MLVIEVSNKDRQDIISYVKDAQEINKEMIRLQNICGSSIDPNHWSAAVAIASAAVTKALNSRQTKKLGCHIKQVVKVLYEFGLTEETGEHITEYYLLDDKERVLHGERITREQSMEFVRAVKKFCTNKLGIEIQEYKS